MIPPKRSLFPFVRLLYPFFVFVFCYDTRHWTLHIRINVHFGSTTAIHCFRLGSPCTIFIHDSNVPTDNGHARALKTVDPYRRPVRIQVETNIN